MSGGSTHMSESEMEVGGAGGSQVENRRDWTSSFPRGHWDLTPARLPHGGGMTSLNSVLQLRIVQDTAVAVCTPVHVCVCACEKVQTWRSVSNEVLAAALATCVLVWSVCVSVRRSHHGCATSGTAVLAAPS